MMDERDMLYKDKMKRSGLNIKEHNFMLGEYVRLKHKKSKWWLAYTNQFSTQLTCVHEPVFYTVIIVSGSSTTGRRVTDGRTICRDWSHFKLFNAIMHENEVRVGGKMSWRHQKTRLKVWLMEARKQNLDGM